MNLKVVALLGSLASWLHANPMQAISHFEIDRTQVTMGELRRFIRFNGASGPEHE